MMNFMKNSCKSYIRTSEEITGEFPGENPTGILKGTPGVLSEEIRKEIDSASIAGIFEKKIVAEASFF